MDIYKFELTYIINNDTVELIIKRRLEGQNFWKIIKTI